MHCSSFTRAISSLQEPCRLFLGGGMPPGGFRMAPNQEQEQPKALEQFVCCCDGWDDR